MRVMVTFAHHQPDHTVFWEVFILPPLWASVDFPNPLCRPEVLRRDHSAYLPFCAAAKMICLTVVVRREDEMLCEGVRRKRRDSSGIYDEENFYCLHGYMMQQMWRSSFCVSESQDKRLHIMFSGVKERRKEGIQNWMKMEKLMFVLKMMNLLGKFSSNPFRAL